MGELKVEPLPVVVASAEAIIGAETKTAVRVAKAARLNFMVGLHPSV
jgi:hypothetical protein